MKELLKEIIGLLAPKEYKDDQRKYLYALNEDQNCTRELLDSFGVDYKEQKSAMRGVTEFIVEVDNDRFIQIQEQIRHDSKYSNIVASWDRKEELANLEVSGVIDTSEYFQGTDRRLSNDTKTYFTDRLKLLEGQYAVIHCIDINGTGTIGNYKIEFLKDYDVQGGVAVNGSIKDTTIYKGVIDIPTNIDWTLTNCTMVNFKMDFKTKEACRSNELKNKVTAGDFISDGNDTDEDFSTYYETTSGGCSSGAGTTVEKTGTYPLFSEYPNKIKAGTELKTKIAVKGSGSGACLTYGKSKIVVQGQKDDDSWIDLHEKKIGDGWGGQPSDWDDATDEKTQTLSVDIKRIKVYLYHHGLGTSGSYTSTYRIYEIQLGDNCFTVDP